MSPLDRNGQRCNPSRLTSLGPSGLFKNQTQLHGWTDRFFVGHGNQPLSGASVPAIVAMDHRQDRVIKCQVLVSSGDLQSALQFLASTRRRATTRARRSMNKDHQVISTLLRYRQSHRLRMADRYSVSCTWQLHVMPATQ